MNIPKGSTIVVGMSGGVDSSVAAMLLLEQGHRVQGLFMKNWEEDDTDEYCAAAQDLDDAQRVCDQLGIPLKTVNFSAEYWDRVFRLFLDEYSAGRTPNPDVLCNKEIKFKAFLEYALSGGADFVATGHYARIKREGDRFQLLTGKDSQKDQSYFLHAIDPAALSRSLFPLGELTKDTVRTLARKATLPTHDKKDSTGICFIGERKFTEFLRQYLPTQPGEIHTIEGNYKGEHQGLMYHTIGQRHGLGIGGPGEPWYVVDKDIDKNILYVAQGVDHPALFSQALIASSLRWLDQQSPHFPLQCTARIRYHQDDQTCTVHALTQDRVNVQFSKPQRAVAPGQSVVFYQGEICLGGGVIQKRAGTPYTSKAGRHSATQKP